MDKRYRVEYTKTDGRVEVHEHLTDAEVAGLGIQQDWKTITRAVIELEGQEPQRGAAGTIGW